MYRLFATIQVVVNAGRDSFVARARTPAASAVGASGGLLAAAVGQVLMRAALNAWIEARGPASLLSSGLTVHDAVVVGATLSLVGLALVLVAAYRVTNQVDAAAEVARAAASRRSPSAFCFTGGLLVLVVGYELSQVDLLTSFVYLGGFYDAEYLLQRAYLVPGLGAIAGVIGLCLLLLGTYRLVTNISTAADASATPIVLQ